MPVVKVYSDKPIPKSLVETIKSKGKKIGYDDPDKIWVVNASMLQQDNVIYVEVCVEQYDRENPNFALFCTSIAYVLIRLLEKSVEVATTPIESVAWAPTIAGQHKYGV